MTVLVAIAIPAKYSPLMFRRRQKKSADEIARGPARLYLLNVRPPGHYSKGHTS